MAGSSQAIGNYRLFDKIGSGGMGSVYLGRLFASGGFRRIVAIKRMHPHLASDADFVSAFLDEARLASRIHHPNVVAPLDVVAKDGEVFVVFEHILGLSLSMLFRNAIADGGGGGRVPTRIATGMMVSVLHGLHAAHEAIDDDGSPLGLVHRDVSPQNILVARDGSARLLDFGIAKASGRAHNTDEGVVKGKRGYMAPEHLLGSPCVASDLYSASVVLWELLAGQRLFPDEASLKERLAQATPLKAPTGDVDVTTLDAIVLRGLRHAPEERFASAREMAIALEETGIATLREIGDWVEQIGRADLDARARMVAAAESAIDTGGSPVSTSASSSLELSTSMESYAVETLIVEPSATAIGLVTSNVAPPSSGMRRIVGIVLALAAIAMVAVVAIVSSRRSVPAAPASSTIVAAPSPPPPPPMASPVDVVPPAPPPASTALATKPPARVAAPPPKRTAPCAPYVIDKDGRKQFNEACLR